MTMAYGKQMKKEDYFCLNVDQSAEDFLNTKFDQ